ncbi:MAG: GNAT family N-acetyltransferase [Xenococcaceae cyanobacterium MO_234.B1]|nr:GNAT family N-acetyltransferase [Xenococcaceae cyanobacterium MO_234.B1]
MSTEPLLRTKRLEIGLLLPSDEPEIIDFIREPNVWKMRGERYSPLVNIHSIYQSNDHEVPWYRYHFVLQMRQSKKPIGFISFYQISQPSLVTPLISQTPYEPVMLSYGLREPYWGQGLMFESLSACVPWFVASQTVRELVGFAEINNRGSRRILQKLGLQEYELLENPRISADLKDRYKFIVYKKRYR